MKIAATKLAGTLLVLLLIYAPSTFAGGVTIKGKVTYQDASIPQMAKISVIAPKADFAKGTNIDANGFYEISGIPYGDIQVTAFGLSVDIDTGGTFKKRLTLDSKSKNPLLLNITLTK
jgi:hypothetical protein